MVSPRAARWVSLVIGVTTTSGAPAPAGVDGPDNGRITTTTTVETNTAAPAMEVVPAPPSAPAATNAPLAKTAPATTNPAPASASVTAVAPAGLPPRATAASDRAIVLGYHQFTGPGAGSKNIYSMSQDVFAGEMKYLRDNGYNVVPLSAVVKFVEHKGTLPPNAVAITIDDGYKSAINYAAPVLKQYGYPWTFFVYPAFITRTESKGAASWPDLLELQKEGVDIESHSMTHPQLTSHLHKFNGSVHNLSPQEYDAFLTEETAGAKQILEHEMGKPIEYFAYPYGAYNQTVEAKAIAAGYEAIFTVADNPVHITTDVHRIGRYIITKPVEKLFASYLRQGALSLAQVNPEPGAVVSNPEPVITAVLGFNGDPKTIETEVRDYGVVKHDFDPATSTIRLYLPRPLIQPEVLVSIRARDVQSGQIMVANWTFNYEPAPGTPQPAHPPIGVPANEPAPGPEGTTNAASTNPGPVMPGAPASSASAPR
jgi:peptidoglycan/xylan/chitin deacetylase (PgdA/CDA1 family)